MKNELQYAGLWERFLALLVDTLLFCAYFFPITRLVKGVWLMSPNDHHWVRGWFIFDPLCLIFLVITALYFVLLEGLAGATLGKWLLGLRVVRMDGSRLDLWKSALARAAVKTSTAKMPCTCRTASRNAPKAGETTSICSATSRSCRRHGSVGPPAP